MSTEQFLKSQERVRSVRRQLDELLARCSCLDLASPLLDEYEAAAAVGALVVTAPLLDRLELLEGVGGVPPTGTTPIASGGSLGAGLP